MKMGRKLFGLLFLFWGLLTIFPASAMAANKGYTISSGNTTVYSNTALTKKYGTIYGTDEVTIHSYSTNKYARVSYPTSRGSKTGYVRFDAVMTASSGYAYTAKAKTTTYRRPSGSTYGYISAGDRVIVLGERGSYTQVYYPVSGGYKFAFVTNSDLNSKIIGSTDNYVNVKNGTYFFTSAVKNNMVMDVYNSESVNGTNIILWENHDGGNQKFIVTALGSGWYKIICAANGKSIDVAEGSSQSGTNVQLYDYNGSYAQQWKFYDAGNGYYYVRNRLGHQLDVNNASSANGTNIQVWEKNTTNAQKWKLNVTSYNPQPSPQPTPTTYYVTANPSLVLRREASTTSAKLASMPNGSAFSVFSITDGWAYGTYNGIKGYASAQYLSQNPNNVYYINGVNIGYKPGSYFTDNGKACTDHNKKGIHSYTNEAACNCICTYNGKSLGAVQCFGFARYVQSKLYGVNSYSSPGSFYKISGSYVAAGKLTAQKLKTIIKSANVGAHIRTNGSAHSMIITNITNNGFSIIQCNGSNNKEYSGYSACRIGTYTYTWSSYVNSTYGKRGINFVEVKK